MNHTGILRIHLRAATAALAVVLTLTLTAIPLRAQTLSVLHSFTGGHDGAGPMAGLTMEAGGALYGTTAYGGAGFGTVFKFAHQNSGWVLTPLYSFGGGPDGANPVARVVIGPDHSLYGTTEYGGSQGYCNNGCGTVFNLKPTPSACKTSICPWIETILRRFTTEEFPRSEVLIDSEGNLFGTANQGGYIGFGGGGSCNPCGDVFELVPSNGGWTEKGVYRFTGYQYGVDGAYPVGGVIFDQAGNLYGTNTSYGDCGFGTVFQLTPSGSGWTEKLLHQFCGGTDGADPASTLIMDEAGNMYGATPGAYPGYGSQRGSAFTLTPSSGGWNYSPIYTFSEYGGGPAASLVMDQAGNLYGTTVTGGNPGCGSYGCGTIFKLSPSNGSWTYTELYDFTGGNDGSNPYSNLVMDASGNFYGTASTGGQSGHGVIFEFTP
jgi:uncharacterized repeat protein (TIGR03803 family)